MACKIENCVMEGENYNLNEIIALGKKRWEKVYDNLGFNGEGSSDQKAKFVKWAQNTLAVSPCAGSYQGKCNEYYREIIEKKIYAVLPERILFQ